MEGTPRDPADVPNQRTASERAAADRAASLRAVFASSPRPGQGADASGRQLGGDRPFGAQPHIEQQRVRPRRRKRRLWLVPVVIALIAVGGGAAYVATRGNPFRPGIPAATADHGSSATPSPQSAVTGLAAEPLPSSSPAPIESAPSPPAPTTTPAGRPNNAKIDLALHKPVESLSDERSGYPAKAAVDGDHTTRWSSGFSDPQWIRVDLGAVWSVTDIKLDWEQAHATKYHVDVSLDGKHWTTVYRTTAGTAGVRDIPIDPTPARYVRMYGTARNGPYGYSLLEFEVR